MWICLNRAFLSVVEYRPKREPGLAQALNVDPAEDLLLVRARRPEHLEYIRDTYLPGFTFVHRPGHDYAYGGLARRNEFAQVLAAVVTDIDYNNFKDSVHDHDLHDAYARVWSVMYGLQDRTPQRYRAPRGQNAFAFDNFEVPGAVLDPAATDTPTNDPVFANGADACLSCGEPLTGPEAVTWCEPCLTTNATDGHADDAPVDAYDEGFNDGWNAAVEHLSPPF